MSCVHWGRSPCSRRTGRAVAGPLPGAELTSDAMPRRVPPCPVGRRSRPGTGRPRQPTTNPAGTGGRRACPCSCRTSAGVQTVRSRAHRSAVAGLPARSAANRPHPEHASGGALRLRDPPRRRPGQAQTEPGPRARVVRQVWRSTLARGPEPRLPGGWSTAHGTTTPALMR